MPAESMKKFDGNDLAGVGLRGRRREWRLRAGAFHIHRERSAGGIFYPGLGVRPKLTGDGKQHQRY